MGLHPTSCLNLVDSFRPRLPGCASPSHLQYLCLCTPGSASDPGPGCYLYHSFHVAQLITSCPINLSVGQSCLHFISPPLILNYPYQYPISQNLGFHQYPLHDTKIKPNQLTLNLLPPYNQTILSSQSKHYVHN